MRLLVTGADGFVGAAAVDAALARNWDVGILLHGDHPPRRLKPAVLAQLRVFRGSLQQTDSLAPELAAWRPDACLHLAWPIAPATYLESPENLEALAGSLELFRLLLQQGCPRIVGAGTCAEYADSQADLAEDSPIRPATLYAAAKHSLFLLGGQLARQAGASFAWARLFNLYGPGEHPGRLVPSAVQTLLAGKTLEATAGLQERDFLHVADVAQALATLAAAPAEGAVNVCSGRGVSVRTMLEELQRQAGVSGRILFGARPPRPWDPPRIVGDPRRLAALGWSPALTLEAGLRDTWDWWRQPAPDPQPQAPGHATP